ncbi:MAG: NUDIX hydrolase [Flavobacteriaceae bacterium]
MKFSEFEHRLLKLKNKSLPGWKSHLELAPENRLELLKQQIKSKKKDAAVSLCFFPDSNQNIRLPLILRNNYNGVHSNQISFPGGKKDDRDITLIDTAIRETNEEIGLIRAEMKLQFKLTNIYIPPSNFLVRPFVFKIKSTPLIKADDKEVSDVLLPKLSEILDLNIQYGPTEKMRQKNPYFLIKNHVVWGATAMILNEFKTIFK